MKYKKGSMQMSMGTIVTIVLLMSVLIMGLMLTRNIMCSGIVLTDQINEKMTNQVQDLFSETQSGVKCMGAGSDEIKIADGGSRRIWCIVNTNNRATYELSVREGSIKTNSETVTPEDIEEWIAFGKSSGETVVDVGGKTITVTTLDIPEEVDTTTVQMKIDVKKEGDLVDTATSQFTIEHVGGFTKSMC